MKIHDIPQGSPGWFLAKRGKIGSSAMDRILTPGKRQYSSQAKAVVAEIIADLMSDDDSYVKRCLEGFQSRDMVNGKKLEAEAREYYALTHGVEVVEVGGLESDCGRWWRSPDAMIVASGEYIGDLEIKCPAPKTHADYMLHPENLVADYKCQCHGGILIHGLWVDLISYGDGVPPVVVRLVHDDFTDALRAALERFDEELNAAKARVIELGGVLA